jgi:hypothetical protein
LDHLYIRKGELCVRLVIYKNSYWNLVRNANAASVGVSCLQRILLASADVEHVGWYCDVRGCSQWVYARNAEPAACRMMGGILTPYMEQLLNRHTTLRLRNLPGRPQSPEV